MLATTSLKLEISVVIFQNDVRKLPLYYTEFQWKPPFNWGGAKTTIKKVVQFPSLTHWLLSYFKASEGSWDLQGVRKTKTSHIIPQKLSYLLSPPKKKRTRPEKKTCLWNWNPFPAVFIFKYQLLHPQSLNTSPPQKRMLQKNDPFLSGFRTIFRGKLAVKLPGEVKFHVQLVGGFKPIEKYQSIGNLPQFSGWKPKMFELPPSSQLYLTLQTFIQPQRPPGHRWGVQCHWLEACSRSIPGGFFCGWWGR